MLEADLMTPVELQAGENDDQLFQLTLDALDETPPAEPIPAGLEEMGPGPLLGAILASIDLSRLRGADVVSVMRAQQRQVSHHQANLYRSMAETAHCVEPDTTVRSPVPNEYAPEEVGAALTLTRRKAIHELGIALGLRTRLPQVETALEDGDIDPRKAAMLVTETDHLSASDAVAVVNRILDEAPDLTTGQLAARLRRLRVEVDPDDAHQRMEYSLTQRKVVAEPNPEGTAALIISECSPDQVYAARDHINRLARRLKTADEPRTIDQIRADVAIGLLTGRNHPNSPGSGAVTVTVDLTTLAGLDRRPGDLAGYGPVVAEIARKVARDQTRGDWSAVVTDPETGEPLHTVSLRRRPTARQRRRIRALQPTCGFPGCRMPAVNCDIDHTVDYARGGPTTVGNQVPLCRRHHMAKHRGRWRYDRLTRTLLEWVSPLGHRYRSRPPPH